LLYVPIALYRPRLSALWFLPLVLWATPLTHSQGVTWRIVLALVVVAVVVVRTVGESRANVKVPWADRSRRLSSSAAASR
jgi:hypothetical protein